MERSTEGTKKLSPGGLTVAWAYRPREVATPRRVDELPNEPNQLL